MHNEVLKQEPTERDGFFSVFIRNRMILIIIAQGIKSNVRLEMLYKGVICVTRLLNENKDDEL